VLWLFSVEESFFSTLFGELMKKELLPQPIRKQRGQGMTEYIIIVALIAVAAIGTYTLFGQTLRNQTAGLALEMSGQSGAPAIANANTNATTASTNANNRKGLDNFDANNR
jgi:Flp pilus assembly pilin Flp